MTGAIPANLSSTLTRLKTVLLFGVMIGHISAFWMPKMADLDVRDVFSWPAITIKILAGFGREAAIAFVFLSGLFTAHHFICNRQPFAPMQMLCRRVARLYPEYAFAICLTLVLDSVGLLVFKSFYAGQTAFAYDPQLHMGWQVLVGNLLFLQPAFTTSLGSNGPLWTIGYLVQFYCVFVLCRTVAPQTGLYWGLAVLAAISAALSGFAEWAAFFLAWLAGAACRAGRLPFEMGRALPIAGVVLLACLARASGLLTSVLLTSLACILIVQSGYERATGTSSVLGPVMRWFSTAAFIAYLTHMPILFLGSAIAVHVFAVSGRGVASFSLMTGVLVFSVFAAHFLFRVVRGSLSPVFR